MSASGALVLGAAGLLRGYRATSHWFVRDALPMFGAIPSKERWVIDRNRATGGGVTAGIDFGLAIMAHVVSEDVARAAQLRLEYSPQPPFRSGTPDEATPETLAAVKSGWSGDAGQIIQAKKYARPIRDDVVLPPDIAAAFPPPEAYAAVKPVTDWVAAAAVGPTGSPFERRAERRGRDHRVASPAHLETDAHRVGPP